MSLFFASCQNNQILACADTRVSSLEDNGEHLVVSDQYPKIRHLQDGLIFMSGNLRLIETVFSMISKDMSINDIQELVRTQYKKANDNTLLITIHIFKMVQGKPVKYQLHNKDNFIIEKQNILNNQVYTAGGDSPEAMKYFQEIYDIADKNLDKKKVSLEELILETYQKFVCPYMGGYLQWHLLNDQGVKQIGLTKLIDKKQYKRYPLNDYNLPYKVHCTADGRLYATNATISGDVTANAIAANTSISSPTIIGGNIYGSIISGNTIIGGSITGTTISSDTTINVNTNLTVGNQITLTGSGDKWINHSSGNIKFGAVSGMTVYADQFIDFQSSLVSIYGKRILTEGDTVVAKFA